jgi:hypothetical protein
VTKKTPPTPRPAAIRQTSTPKAATSHQQSTPQQSKRPTAAKTPLLSAVLKKQIDANERRDRDQGKLTLLDFLADLK